MKTVTKALPGLRPARLIPTAVALALLLGGLPATSADVAPVTAPVPATEVVDPTEPAAPPAETPVEAPDETQIEPDTDADASLSPSQVSADRINAIRANEYFYQSYGKGDPFSVLVDGDFQQAGAAELVDVNSARLVGVMWGQDDRFALVEDGDGFGYILRVGDQVRSGRIVSIRKNSLTAQVTLYGITSNVVLKLENLED
jgi:hypothetical protein